MIEREDEGMGECKEGKRGKGDKEVRGIGGKEKWEKE